MINPINILKYIGDILHWIGRILVFISGYTLKAFLTFLILILGLLGGIYAIIFVAASLMIIMQFIILFM